MNGWSLFSGIGGFDEGLRRAGVTITYQCEADEYRRSVLAHRFPGVECSTDVREVAHSDDGQVDIVCGGFPCQDLSVAGRRAGLNGTRSSLFFEFARIADLVLPAGGWILAENVPGLLSSQGGRDFAVVLATLAELGFHDLAWRILDSRHFGVAQRRRRVYILARRARGDRACQVLLEPTSSVGDSQARREAGQGVAPALSGRSPTRLDDQGSGQLVPDHYYVEDFEDGTLTSSTGRIDRHPLVAAPLEASDGHHGYSSPRGDGADNLIADTLTSGSHPASNTPGRRREDDTNIVAVAENMRHELRETPYTNSLGGGGGKPGQGYQMARIGNGVRRLTPRECERLQGFPDDWTLIPSASDSKRYAALGDAVTVPVAEWIGRRLIEVAA